MRFSLAHMKVRFIHYNGVRCRRRRWLLVGRTIITENRRVYAPCSVRTLWEVGNRSDPCKMTLVSFTSQTNLRILTVIIHRLVHRYLFQVRSYSSMNTKLSIAYNEGVTLSYLERKVSEPFKNQNERPGSYQHGLSDCQR